MTDVSAAMRRGSLVDSLLLGGKGVVRVPGFADWRTKAAREARDDAEARGEIPALDHEYEAALVTVQRIRARLVEFGLQIDESQQLAIEWTETASNGNPVVCRGKLDNFSHTKALIWDLKIRDNVKPRKCEAHIVDMAYDIQGAAYTRAVEALYPELQGRVRFLDLFCEPEPPHCMTPIEFSGSMRELGALKWQRAVDTWEQCLRMGRWPGYVTEIYRAEAPAWAINEEQYA